MISSTLRRAVFEPLYYRKNNSPKLAYWRELEKTQFLSLQKLQDIQWQRLQKIYAFLWEKNRFFRSRFREAGLNPQSLKKPADIIKLPILTKKDIRKNSELMISEGSDKDSLLHFKTGGSTGKALEIHTTHKCSALRNACTRRHDRWTGWEPGEPVAAVWGNPELPKTWKEKLKNALVLPYIFLDTMAVHDQAVIDFAREWGRVRPTLLFGHAHSIFLLAQYLDRLKIDELRPIGIISTSMMLLPHERTVIEKVFKCRVTDRYGCEEVSLIGSECERHEGMHMNIEHLVIEFIKDDGTIANPGEPGNIVVTDLMNYAMPFIRYKVEDIGVPMDRMCSCGRGLPLMGNIAGRVADFLVKKDGTKVAGISLIENTLTKMPGIDQMQIIQETLNEIRLNIVPGKEHTTGVSKELIGYFSQVFPGVQVTLNEVMDISPELSGKYRFSICRIDSEQAMNS